MFLPKTRKAVLTFPRVKLSRTRRCRTRFRGRLDLLPGTHRYPKKPQMKSMPPQKTALGEEIFIHGGVTSNHWTDGCDQGKSGRSDR
jgi:hypothetical protein